MPQKPGGSFVRFIHKG
ncbi:hypothetical protein Patl1_18344 [Pistacia atlantica]|uniref:Uncharacterized protein n=1 Tax=Pistacia atlantica TaxID=434234 RepID=A0ACC1C291_9ROSI|nr:hypothetical protein Patl1_18344 [Pistacia atlantica]